MCDLPHVYFYLVVYQGVCERLDIFSIYFFQGLSFLHLEITLPIAKLTYAFEEKQFFSVTVIS